MADTPTLDECLDALDILARATADLTGSAVVSDAHVLYTTTAAHLRDLRAAVARVREVHVETTKVGFTGTVYTTGRCKCGVTASRCGTLAALRALDAGGGA
jgi:hypothetical protein